MKIRRPCVAGSFYPADAGRLRGMVEGFLPKGVDRAPALAALVPHAGYVYSGPVAASAYARLADARDIIRRVVLLGPAHRVPFKGVAASGAFRRCDLVQRRGCE